MLNEMDASSQDAGSGTHAVAENVPGHVTESATALNVRSSAADARSQRSSKHQQKGSLLPHMDHVIHRLNLNMTLQDNANDFTSPDDVTCDTPTTPEAAASADVTSSKKKRRKGKKPSLRVFKGTFIHATWSNPLVILRDKVLGVQDGKIVFIEDSSSLDHLLDQYKATAWRNSIVLDVSDPLFFIPGFVDCHAHTFPYCTRGLQGDSNPESQERLREKTSMVNNDRFTKQVIKDVLRQSLQNGTTSAAWHGTSVESAAIILSNFIDSSRQRSQIGIDFKCDQPKEDVQMLHVTKATDVTTTISKMHKNGSRVSASVISSVPLVDWLESKMATLRNHLRIPMKANACKQDGSSRLGDLERLGVLDENTMLTNFCGLQPRDFKLIAEKGSKVVHCPSADYSSPNHKCIIPDIIRKNIKVGLGSDMLNSNSLSMVNSIRNCVERSRNHLKYTRHLNGLENRIRDLDNHVRHLEKTIRKIQSQEEFTEPQKAVIGEFLEPLQEESVSYEEAFRMSTLGGAAVLGIEEYVGSFEVGKDFDALLIHPSVDDSSFTIYPPLDDPQDILQKFLFTGDDRNILQVYIAGERVK